jgi:hypothetical protein
MGFQRTLCIDFDGVLHFYRDGWKGPTEIYDMPVPGAIEWITELTESEEFEVAIYSSRSKHEGGIDAMKGWLGKYGATAEVVEKILFPTEKPAAWITIDDRCFQFRGEFPKAEYLLGYQAWMKRPTLEGVMADVRILREIGDSYRNTFPEHCERLNRIADELEGTRS